MKPAYKIGIAAAGLTATSWFAARSAWRGLNNAKWVGLVVVALVSYHTFDSYRASVDNAWGKVESVIDGRAAKAEAERIAAIRVEAIYAAETAARERATAAFNLQKAEDMRIANERYEAGVKAAEIAKAEAKAKAKAPSWRDAPEVPWKYDSTATGVDCSAIHGARLTQLQRQGRCKPPKIANPYDQFDNAAPWKDDQIDRVATARIKVAKARAICRELYNNPSYRWSDNFCQSEAWQNFNAAQKELAAALLAAN